MRDRASSSKDLFEDQNKNNGSNSSRTRVKSSRTFKLEKRDSTDEKEIKKRMIPDVPLEVLIWSKEMQKEIREYPNRPKKRVVKTKKTAEKRLSQPKVTPIIVKLSSREEDGSKKTQSLTQELKLSSRKEDILKEKEFMPSTPKEKKTKKKKIVKRRYSQNILSDIPKEEENKELKDIKKKKKKKMVLKKRIVKKKSKVSLVEAKKNTLKSINKFGSVKLKKFEHITSEFGNQFPIIVQNSSGCSISVLINRNNTITEIIKQILKLHRSHFIPPSMTIDKFFLAGVALKKTSKLTDYPILETIKNVTQTRRFLVTFRKSNESDFDMDVEMAYYQRITPYV